MILSIHYGKLVHDDDDDDGHDDDYDTVYSHIAIRYDDDENDGEFEAATSGTHMGSSPDRKSVV